MNTFSHVPPGFRFHPTDEELVDYYLRKKINSRQIDLDIIKDVDLYKIEPWDLQDICRIGTEEQNDWYFFSHKDKKYPTGTRTNRATSSGFWKATGRDKAIYSKYDLVGMRKTLVFYRGRAPNGQKSDWIIHEYRLQTDENGAQQEEGWVVCRAFKKRISIVPKMSEHESPIWYDDQVSFMPELDSPNQNPHSNLAYHQSYTCKKEQDLQFQVPHQHFLQLPLLESPKQLQSAANNVSCNSIYGLDINQATTMQSSLPTQEQISDHQVTDWRVLDKFVASQLSHEDASKENYTSNDMFQESDHPNLLVRRLNKKQLDREIASTSTSNSQNDLWN